MPVAVDPSPTVHLLQGYDEYIMGYTETKSLIDLDGSAGYSPTDRAIYVGVLLLDGQFAGNWKRTIGRDEVVIHVQLTRAFDDAALEALHEAAARHGAFLGLPAVVARRLSGLEDRYRRRPCGAPASRNDSARRHNETITRWPARGSISRRASGRWPCHHRPCRDPNRSLIP